MKRYIQYPCLLICLIFVCLIFFLQKLFFIDEDRKHEDKWGEDRFFFCHILSLKWDYEMPKIKHVLDLQEYKINLY